MLASTAIRRKHRLLYYALKHEIPIPQGFNPASGVFGRAAKALLERVQAHMGVKVTGRWSREVGKKIPLTLALVRHDWKWRYALGRRIGQPPGVVPHHAAAKTLTPERLHEIHLGNGWSGFGYHRLIRKDGSIHQGRPEWAIGAHAPGANHWLAACFEGNYEVETEMPLEQFVAGRYQIARWRHKYGTLKFARHRDFVATACPGKRFPFERLTAR